MKVVAKEGKAMFEVIWERSFTKSYHQRMTQSAFTCCKLTIEALEQDVKYVQS